jgi:hypothetical protein
MATGRPSAHDGVPRSGRRLTYGDPAAVGRARRRLGAVPTRQSSRLRKIVTEPPWDGTPWDGNPLTTIV